MSSTANADLRCQSSEVAEPTGLIVTKSEEMSNVSSIANTSNKKRKGSNGSEGLLEAEEELTPAGQSREHRRFQHRLVEKRRRERVNQHYQELDTICLKLNPSISLQRRERDTILVNSIRALQNLISENEQLKRKLSMGPTTPSAALSPSTEILPAIVAPLPDPLKPTLATTTTVSVADPRSVRLASEVTLDPSNRSLTEAMFVHQLQQQQQQTQLMQQQQNLKQREQVQLQLESIMRQQIPPQPVAPPSAFLSSLMQYLQQKHSSTGVPVAASYPPSSDGVSALSTSTFIPSNHLEASASPYSGVTLHSQSFFPMQNGAANLPRAQTVTSGADGSHFRDSYDADHPY
jgi:hypothetical protein